ncbi:MAG: recombinase RecA [Candidatus Wallbacteria bacterium HGW-Wallbacteria-1]|jgi:recombination protein RecA|uniref:Protein RecA n=1 Tax=Candidatus Wallbacteria bacterium HGW-Wallbacteria-1 TaxID=2013854 RepID=A0A2N1PQH9_9BACT|nr:MAG: recombinase RecA [Candidatus Wallbacteria bacterium HGW-Wallbacteria-1]
MELFPGQQELKKSLTEIVKRYGPGSVMRMGEGPSWMPSDVFSTGSPTLDQAIGIGGLPAGRIIEIFGPEGSGKTTLALSSMARAQERGCEVAFIDVEHALDPAYASALGLSLDRLVVSQPQCAEEALGIAELLMKSGAIDMVVIDSVAALVPRAEMEGNIGDMMVGLQARIMSQALRRLAGVSSNSKCALVFINQLREKVGVTFGSPETTPGGRALKFYSSVRLDVRRKEVLRDGEKIVGNVVAVKVVKNKVAPPFGKAEIELYYGRGFSVCSEIMKMAVDAGIIEKAGAWYRLDGETIGQGRDQTIRTIEQNESIRLRLTESLGMRMVDSPVVPEDEGESEKMESVDTKGNQTQFAELSDFAADLSLDDKMRVEAA